MISLDVISLYTNIPITLIEPIITKSWQELEQYTNIPKTEFIKALNFTLFSNYFQFKNNYYKQIDGVAMGSPISSNIAQIIMEDLEITITNKINYIQFYTRYVDDLFLIIPRDKVNEILNLFNSYHPKLQFTIETEKKNTINYLDLTLIKKDNKILTKWYSKPTASGRLLNYHSNHPYRQKIAVLNNTIQRIIKLTSPELRIETLHTTTKILKNNNYPTKLISNSIKQQTEKLYNSIQYEKQEKNTNITYLTLPYIPPLTQKIKNLLKPHNFQITYKPINTIKQFYTPLKTKIPKETRTHTIYSIKCKECNKQYIGQTGQYLKNRLQQHKNNNNYTALKKHQEQTDHTFDFDNTKIITTEQHKQKRQFLEMIHIQKNLNTCVNDRTDIQGLSNTYYTVI